MKNDYTNLVSRNPIEAPLTIANAHIQKANPSLWDGKGEMPEDFDARIITYQITQYAELDISFAQDKNGDRGYVYELREPVTHELVDTTYGYIINDPYTMATTIAYTIIACVTYDNFRNKQTEPFDLSGFMAYMEQEFSCMESPFLRTMIENIVEYAVKTKGHTKDDIVYFLEVLIPEIKFGEIAIFTSESLLIPHGKYIAAVARLKWEVSKCR